MAKHTVLTSGWMDRLRSIANRCANRTRVERTEDGFTLVELMVVLPFLLIVTTLVMSTLVTAYGAESRVQSTSQSSGQVTLAFLSLDDEVRYATDINQPGQDTSSPPNYYVEFESDWNTNSQSEPDCTQLEYNNSAGKLQQRSWYVGGTIPTGWQVLASSLKTSISTDPFTLSNRAAPWQLSFKISSAAVDLGSTGNAQSSFSITALNTSSNSSSSNICGGTP
jgi:type II secretory pathway pseudopilin PulG